MATSPWGKSGASKSPNARDTCPGHASGHEYGGGDTCSWCSQDRPRSAVGAIPVSRLLVLGATLAVGLVVAVALASWWLDR